MVVWCGVVLISHWAYQAYQAYYFVMEISLELSVVGPVIFSALFSEYCTLGPVRFGITATILLATVCFILTKLTKEYSWVDRLWSVLPILYALHFLIAQHHCLHILPSLRQLLILFLTFLWGLRLTFNFWRKGGYRPGGGEDYRWKYLRDRLPWLFMEILNFIFTAYCQLLLIFWFSSPIMYSNARKFNVTDWVLGVAWVLLFAGEVLADEQQWQFQKEKQAQLRKNEDNVDNIPMPYKRGFIKEGLFRYSRHPNFFCELSMWWVIYLFSVNSIGWNLSGGGAVFLTGLFFLSTLLTERISSEKYPAYRTYQQETSMLIPLPPKLDKLNTKTE